MLAEYSGEAFFELADAGGEAQCAFVGGEKVGLEGCPGDGGPVAGGRGG